MAKILFLLFMVSEQENDFRYVRPKLEKIEIRRIRSKLELE